VIVLDASAILELLLVTAKGRAVAERIASPQETLHAPHLINLEVARTRGIRRYEIDAWLALARAERAAGDPDSLRRAHAALAQVDTLADAIRGPNWRLVAELERAGISSAAGDAAARERHLRTALAGFEKIEAEYRVRQIRALLSAEA
jgi:hypothetical protein